MNTCWILISNSTQATIYKTQKLKLLKGEAKLVPVHNYSHLASREKVHELVTDKKGHYMNGRSGSGDFSEHSNPKEHEFDKFAQLICEELNKNRIANHYQELIVVAPDHFLGLINRHLDKHVDALVSHKITKDYFQLKPEELEKQLPEFL